MAKWCDLPLEIRQMIFSMIPEVDSIIYIPKDGRKKVDHRHLQAHHFHDILTVSKTFITPDEFAFAVLGTARLNFYSFNELHRLVMEVRPEVKQCVRRIQLTRRMFGRDPALASDSFQGFSNIEQTLSQNMPELRQIYVSFDDYCAEIAHYDLGTDVAPLSTECRASILEDALLAARNNTAIQQEDADRAYKLANLKIMPTRLPNVIASFLGDRTTSRAVTTPSRSYYPYTRPHAWIRRLIDYAESTNIEVIFNVDLCISNAGDVGRHQMYAIRDDGNLNVFGRRQCWSNRSYPIVPHKPLFWTIHTPAQMSTRDWMLRVRSGDEEFAFHQQLAYDMLHAPKAKRLGWWMALMRDMRCSRAFGSFMF